MSHADKKHQDPVYLGANNKIRVWDLPTRLFHWTLVLCIIGLVVSGNIGGNAMEWHFRLGYAVFTLLLFRLLWGIFGGKWSRFSSFFYTPAKVIAYVRGKYDASDRLGHNPLGAFSVWALLLALAAQVGSGLFSDDEIAAAGPLTYKASAEFIEKASYYHTEIGKKIIIILIILHVSSVIFYLVAKKRNLIRPMLQGDKWVAKTARTVAASLDNSKTRLLALVLLLLCAALVAWIVSAPHG